MNNGRCADPLARAAAQGAIDDTKSLCIAPNDPASGRSAAPPLPTPVPEGGLGHAVSGACPRPVMAVFLKALTGACRKTPGADLLGCAGA